MFARTVLALSLVVRVYDNTGLTPGQRAVALTAAHAILEQAGIVVTWRDGGERGDAGASGEAGESRRPQDLPAFSAGLIVRIVAAPPQAVTGSLGYSLVDVAQRTGTLATVYADRVSALAADAGTDAGRLLGRAIAHEIGHLLLGTTRHADRGLMRGLWTTIELQRDQPWDWTLSRDDISLMRRGLVTHLRRPEHPEAVVARNQKPPLASQP